MTFTAVNTHAKNPGSVLLLTGAVATTVFVLMVVIGGIVTDGYSHVSQPVSELAATGAEHAGLQTVAFLVVGLGVCCFAAGLHLVGRVPVIATVLVTAFGVLSGLTQAALPCDEGCEPTTATGTAHIITGASGFVAVLIAMFVLGRHWRRSDEHAALARPTLLLAWGALLGLVAFNLTRARDVESLDGLTQRVFVLCVVIWLVMTALTLHRLAHPAEDTQREGVPAGTPSSV